jgi:hypothetical protein
MKNPPHRGELVHEDVVKTLGLTVTLGMQTDRNLARVRARQAEITARIQRFRPDVG